MWVHCPRILLSLRQYGQEESRLLNLRRLRFSRWALIFSMTSPTWKASALEERWDLIGSLRELSSAPPCSRELWGGIVQSLPVLTRTLPVAHRLCASAAKQTRQCLVFLPIRLDSLLSFTIAESKLGREKVLLLLRDRKGTQKNLCDKDFAALSDELSAAICLKNPCYIRPWIVQKILWRSSCDILALGFFLGPWITNVHTYALLNAISNPQDVANSSDVISYVALHWSRCFWLKSCR